jgi:hypothetical protein
VRVRQVGLASAHRREAAAATGGAEERLLFVNSQKRNAVPPHSAQGRRGSTSSWSRSPSAEKRLQLAQCAVASYQGVTLPQ